MQAWRALQRPRRGPLTSLPGALQIRPTFDYLSAEKVIPATGASFSIYDDQERHLATVALANEPYLVRGLCTGSGAGFRRRLTASYRLQYLQPDTFDPAAKDALLLRDPDTDKVYWVLYEGLKKQASRTAFETVYTDRFVKELNKAGAVPEGAIILQGRECGATDLLVGFRERDEFSGFSFKGATQGDSHQFVFAGQPLRGEKHKALKNELARGLTVIDFGYDGNPKAFGDMTHAFLFDPAKLDALDDVLEKRRLAGKSDRTCVALTADWTARPQNVNDLSRLLQGARVGHGDDAWRELVEAVRPVLLNQLQVGFLLLPFSLPRTDTLFCADSRQAAQGAGRAVTDRFHQGD